MLRLCSLSNFKDFLFVAGILLSCSVGVLGGWFDLIGLGSEDDSGQSVKVLYGENHGIFLSDVEKTEREDPLLNEQDINVYGLDYHYNYGLLFFSGRGHIWSLKLNETRKQQVLVENATGAGSVAVDWVHDTVYWVDPDRQTVHRVQLTGEDRQVIIKNTGDISRMNNLVLDPYQRLMFLAVEGVGFMRTDLDGRGYRTIEVKKDEYLREVALAIDISNRRLYVSSRQDLVPRIITCNYYGTQVMELDISEEWWDSFISIGVYKSEFLFWVQHVPQDRDSVWKASISDPKNITWQMEYRPLIATAARIWVLKVFHSDLQSLPEDHPIEMSEETTEYQQEGLPVASSLSADNHGSSILLIAVVTCFSFTHYIFMK